MVWSSDAGIVDEHIYVARFVLDLLDSGVDCERVRDIADDGDDDPFSSPDGFDCVVQSVDSSTENVDSGCIAFGESCGDG